MHVRGQSEVLDGQDVSHTMAWCHLLLDCPRASTAHRPPLITHTFVDINIPGLSYLDAISECAGVWRWGRGETETEVVFH
jgi:hypothetical protein